MTLDLLKTIAEAVRALPGCGAYPEVRLGTDAPAAVALLGELPGAQRTVRVYDGKATREAPYVIVSAEVRVGGVTFRAAFDRPATAEEIADLEREGRPYDRAHAEDFRALTRAA